MEEVIPDRVPMTVPEILAALDQCGRRFPTQALQDAVLQQETVTPELLRVLAETLANPQRVIDGEGSNLLSFAVYLLAQFREPRAFQPIAALVALPGETPFDLLGDTVTESLARILGSVWDGDVAGLRRLVEDEAVNEYVRFAAVDTFIVLAHSGQMARDAVVAYYRGLFHGGLPRVWSHAWDALVCAVADLPAPELLEDVRQAYADELVELFFADLSTIERRLVEPPGRRLDDYRVITDVVAEMKGWVYFREPAKPKTAPASPALRPRPIVGGVKVGRNDPCPCGSGKKFKKCCVA